MQGLTALSVPTTALASPPSRPLATPAQTPGTTPRQRRAPLSQHALRLPRQRGTIMASATSAASSQVELLAGMPFPERTPLAASEEGSFAHATISERLPSIVQNIIAEVRSHNEAEASSIVADLEAMCEEMRNNGTVPPVATAVAGQDADFDKILTWTNDSLQAWTRVTGETTWWGLPWLLVECYMYVRISAALRAAPHVFGASYDPFAKQKAAAWASCGQAVAAAAADGAEALAKLGGGACNADETPMDLVFGIVQGSLWGNRVDLSLLVDAGKVDPTAVAKEVEAAAADGQTHPFLLVDDWPAMWRGLLMPRGHMPTSKRVDIVLDNAGMEVFGDLLLADAIITAGLADHVRFHGKAIPWFVSDVMGADIEGMIAACEADNPSVPGWEAVQGLAARWREHMAAKRWSFSAHPFWTSPFPMCWMETMAPELYREFETGTNLLIFKGDLNYRKLTFDCRWPTTTPFSEAMGVFEPCAFATLRTLKADVVVGLPEGLAEKMDDVDPDWQVNGKFGVLQVFVP